MNVYDLSRKYWDFAFENPDKIKPNHTALYFFAIEHCNRLGWKDKFGFPTSMAMEAISIKSYNTFIKTLNDLIEYGFITMIQKSSNQYSANVIALSKFNKANNKALDEALIKHSAKQVESTVQTTSESTVQSIDSIDKQTNNITNIPINNVLLEKEPKGEEVSDNFSSEDFTLVNPDADLSKKVAKKKVFIPPAPDEVQEYCNERNNGITGEEFVNFYQSKGWMVGSNKMKDWHAAVRTWELSRKNNGKSNSHTGASGNDTRSEQATYNIQAAAERLADDFAKGNIPGVYR